MASAIDLVRSISTAWERGDFSSADWAHPEVEYVIADGPTAGRWTGLAGMAEATRTWLSAWEDMRVGIEDYRELDDERVLVLIRFQARGKLSGLELGEVGTKSANLFHVRDGKVTKIVQYLDRDRALADVGIATENGAAKPADDTAARTNASLAVVRRLIRGFSERDFDAGLHDVEDHVVGSYIDAFSGPVTLRGRDEVKAWWERIARVWEYMHIQEEELLEARPDLIVMSVRFKARGRGTRVDVEGSQQFEVWRLRDGKIVGFEFFFDKAQALEAARGRGPTVQDAAQARPPQTARAPRSRDVTVEVGDDFVATVELHRPPDNHVDLELLAALADAYEELDRDPACRAIVLCSEGKHFCAGVQFAGAAAGASGEQFGSGGFYGEAIRLFATGTPVVAAVQGAAVGGGLGLALSADFRIASPESRFWANFARLGFHHGFGMTVTLPAVVGEQAARELLYTARRVRGEEALSLGLCDRLVAAEQIRSEAHALAAEIASAAPLAVRSIRATLRGDLAERVRRATEREQAEQVRLMQTEDFGEGVRAMAERRDPEFGGR